MKTSVILAFSIINLLLLSCNKRHTLAVLDRNCTGTYLEVDDRSYRVCNVEKLSSYENGDMIDVHFRVTDECDNLDEVICMMAVEYDASVEILSVN